MESSRIKLTLKVNDATNLEVSRPEASDINAKLVGLFAGFCELSKYGGALIPFTPCLLDV